MLKFLVKLIIGLIVFTFVMEKTKPLRIKAKKSYTLMNEILDGTTETISNLNVDEYDSYAFQENLDKLGEDTNELLELWNIDGE